VKGFLQGQAFIKGLVKAGFQALLQVEMDEHLGYEKYSREGSGLGNCRNGKSEKTVRGDFEEVAIETPRDRNFTFEPLLVKKRETSVGNFADKIISLYACGLTAREIEEHLRRLYGVDVSPQFISRAAQRIQQELIDWQNRPLEPLYPLVYVVMACV